MKIRLVVTLIFVGLVTIFALPTFAQEQKTVDPEVRQQIEALLIKFGEAFNKHDPTAITALYTQNAIRLESWWSESNLGQQAIEKSYTAMLTSSPGEFVGQVVEVYPIGNDMCVITKDSEGALWKGYKTWICNRDADTWKIRMEYVN
jgi:ketosteroid isomerase-like protein